MRRVLSKNLLIYKLARNIRDIAQVIPLGFFPIHFNANKSRKFHQFTQWEFTSFASPSPIFIKQACIKRNAIMGSTFIETGTFLGSTTEYAAKFSNRVISLEPDEYLFKKAKEVLIRFKNIEILHGTSEDVFPKIIPTLSGDITFWLDGHYSGGVTYQSIKDTPIVLELNEIEKNMKNFARLSIMVDDFRLFNPLEIEFKDYPKNTYLVNWADKNSLYWTVEQDIFIAKNFYN